MTARWRRVRGAGWFVYAATTSVTRLAGEAAALTAFRVRRGAVHDGAAMSLTTGDAGVLCWSAAGDTVRRGDVLLVPSPQAQARVAQVSAVRYAATPTGTRSVGRAVLLPGACLLAGHVTSIAGAARPGGLRGQR